VELAVVHVHVLALLVFDHVMRGERLADQLITAKPRPSLAWLPGPGSWRWPSSEATDGTDS
jgi:hypothetical protein